jgi:hypothetical protein
MIVGRRAGTRCAGSMGEHAVSDAGNNSGDASIQDVEGAGAGAGASADDGGGDRLLGPGGGLAGRRPPRATGLGELVEDDDGGHDEGLYDAVERATKREELRTAARELVLAQEHASQLGGQDARCSSAARY